MEMIILVVVVFVIAGGCFFWRKSDYRTYEINHELDRFRDENGGVSM